MLGFGQHTHLVVISFAPVGGAALDPYRVLTNIANLKLKTETDYD